MLFKENDKKDCMFSIVTVILQIFLNMAEFTDVESVDGEGQLYPQVKL